jgi:hypothetical protein
MTGAQTLRRGVASALLTAAVIAATHAYAQH